MTEDYDFIPTVHPMFWVVVSVLTMVAFVMGYYL